MGTETWKGDQGKYEKISSPDQFHSDFELFGKLFAFHHQMHFAFNAYNLYHSRLAQYKSNQSGIKLL